MNEIIRQVCSGCRRSLKIKIDQVPTEDFAIECPKCQTEVVVRVSTVQAALQSADGGEAAPEQGAPPRSSKPVGGFGATDLTDSLGHANDSGGGAVPDYGEGPAEPSLSAKRIIPRNAPRTSPPPQEAGLPGIIAKLPPWPLLAAGGAGILLLLIVLVWAIRPRGGADVPSSVASDESVKADIAAIGTTVKGPPGEAPELFRNGMDKFRGDSLAEHREAGELFRRALAAAPHHPEPLAALALNSVFLPKSDRGGIGVAQANVWSDYVQRTMPDSVLGGTARAALLASLGRADDARALAAKQTVNHAASPLAWFIQGHILRDTEPKKAAESFRKALSLDPGFRIAESSLAGVELKLGNVRAASIAIRGREQRGPPSSVSRRIAAGVETALGDETSALASLEAAVAAEPKDVEARLAYGWRLSAAGSAALAREQARRVIDVDRPAEDASEAQLADANLLLADALRREGKGQDAVTAAQAALRNHPSRAAAQYQLGLALLAAGRPDEAAEALRDAATRDAKRVEIQLALGQAAMRVSRFEDAIGAFQAAGALDGGLAIVHANLASLFVDAEIASRAVDEWERMITSSRPLAPVVGAPSDPRFPRPVFDLDGALKRLRRVEAGDPNRDSRYRLYEGALLCEGGRIGEGLKKFNQVRGMEPEHAAYVAGWWLAAGRGSDAAKVVSRPETAAQHATRGFALKAARLPGADVAFQKALQLDGEDPYARLGLAQFYLSKGQAKQALPHALAARARLGDAPAVMKALFEAEG